MKSRRWRAIAKADLYLNRKKGGFNPMIPIVDELTIHVDVANKSDLTVINEQINHLAPLNIFPIPKAWFSKIENALDLKLTAIQRSKLFNPDGYYFGGRDTKRAVVHCILLALSIGPPLSIRTAMNYAEGVVTKQDSLFYKLYKVIAEKLEGAGFSVRQVGDIGGWKLQY